MCTRWNVTQPGAQKDVAVCNDMDGTGEYDSEQKSYLFFFLCLFLRERRSVSRGGAEGEGGTESEAGPRL